MKNFEEKKNEFKRIESQLLEHFNRDLEMKELIKNGTFITNLSKENTELNGDLKCELIFKNRSSLNQFIDSISDYDFGGDEVVVNRVDNGRRKKCKYYGLVFGDSEVLINLNRTYKLKNLKESFYVLSDGTLSVKFNS